MPRCGSSTERERESEREGERERERAKRLVCERENLRFIQAELEGVDAWTAHGPVYHLTLGLGVIKKKVENAAAPRPGLRFRVGGL